MRRIEFTPVIAALAAGLAAWFSLGSLAASDTSTASRFGFLPSIWLLPALMALFAGAAWAMGLSTRRSLPMFFSLVVLLPWLPGSIPAAFLIWSGRIVWAVWAIVAVAMLAVGDGRSAPSSAMAATGIRPLLGPPAAIAFAAYLVGGWWLSPVLPGGDEPHYLVITQSLLYDRDLKVENNYLARQYESYYPAVMRPHYLKRGTNGEIYSIHAPGVAAVVAPAFAIFGYPGVVVFLSLVAAIGSALLWRAAHLLTGSVPAAWFAWAAGALSVPFFFESFAVFPDGVGATVVLFAALPLFMGRTSRVEWTAVGAALGLLPWLHTRFAVLAAVLGLVHVLRLAGSAEERSKIVPFLAPAAASAAAWFMFFRIIYGTFNPSAPYGRDTQTSAANILRGLPALWLDHQFGVLPYAPIYGFCLIGLLVLARQRLRLAIELGAVALAYLLAVSSFHMWWGGASAPARFLTPILPMLAIPSAWLWATTPRASTRAAGIGLLVLSLMTTATLVSVDSGRLAFNVRDGYARGAEWMNALVDVPLALPSFFRHTPQVAAARAAVWIAFMAAAVLALRGLERRTDPRSSFALALPLAFAVAVMGAVSTVWALDGVTPVKPDDSQMSVLTDYDVGVRPTGVDISHGRIETAGALVSTLAIATPIRRAPVPARTLLLVPSIVPAGEYELRIAPGAEVSGEARLVIGREARPSKTWNLATEFHDGAAELRLPATVGSLSILGDHAPPGALTLHPKRLWGGKARLSPDFARRVERYGPATVFFYDTEAFPEVPGFWVKGGRTSSMAVALEDRSAHARIFLRNAAAINRVSLEVDGDEQVLDLQPGEERQMNLPMADGRPGALIRIESASGFRPIDVDPASRDSRYLGVWVEFR